MFYLEKFKVDFILSLKDVRSIKNILMLRIYIFG